MTTATNANPSISVLLVDDHAVVREGYRALLSRQPDIEVVGEAGDAESAYVMARKLLPHVVVMDISLPGPSGLTALARIHQRLPGIRFLVFSMHTHTTYVTQAFEAGATGYVTKSSPPDDLVQALREIRHGRRYLSADVAQGLAHERLGYERAALASLSPREFEVLRLLVAAHPVDAIATMLHLSPKTVMNLHYAIKRKLDVNTDIELLRLALRLDVLQVPESDNC